MPGSQPAAAKPARKEKQEPQTGPGPRTGTASPRGKKEVGAASLVGEARKEAPAPGRRGVQSSARPLGEPGPQSRARGRSRCGGGRRRGRQEEGRRAQLARRGAVSRLVKLGASVTTIGPLEAAAGP